MGGCGNLVGFVSCLVLLQFEFGLSHAVNVNVNVYVTVQMSVLVISESAGVIIILGDTHISLEGGSKTTRRHAAPQIAEARDFRERDPDEGWAQSYPLSTRRCLCQPATNDANACEPVQTN